jgi:hypothetical protein
MIENELQQRVREKLGLRVGPEVAAYLARRLEQPAASILVMAGDARTGRPLLAELDSRELRAAAADPS